MGSWLCSSQVPVRPENAGTFIGQKIKGNLFPYDYDYVA